MEFTVCFEIRPDAGENVYVAVLVMTIFQFLRRCLSWSDGLLTRPTPLPLNFQAQVSLSPKPVG